MNERDAKKIIEFLRKNGELSAKDVEEAGTGKDSASALTALVHLGVITDEQLAKAKGDLWQVPYEDLVGKPVRNSVFDFIPLDLAKTYQMVPFEKRGNKVFVGFIDPQNVRAIEALDFMGREREVEFKIFVISEGSYKYVLQKYENLSTQVEEALSEAQLKGMTKEAGSEVAGEEDVEEVIKSAPVSKVVHVILKHAIEGMASDVHIEPLMDQTRVRYRLDGNLHTSILLPKGIHAAVVSRIKIMSNLKIDETRRPQDGRFRLSMSGRDIDCRVSILPLYRQEKVVMRILDPHATVTDLDHLGFRGSSALALKRAIAKPHGIILSTGPTGSGKSTTLYALLNILNKDQDNIVTLEDPVEYYLQGVNQSQINVEVGFGFASGLRSVLRQDPDIIMVGEVRDNETAELMIHAGLTGHIVLSTLHTNDAIGAVPRLMDMKIEPYLIASSLNIVVAQRLVRMICKRCVEIVRPPKEVVDEIKSELADIPVSARPSGFSLNRSFQLSRGRGCPRCNMTGYRGRIAIVEAFEITDEIREMILSRVSPAEQLKVARRNGMLTMKEEGLLKAVDGLTTFEEILHVTKE